MAVIVNYMRVYNMWLICNYLNCKGSSLQSSLRHLSILSNSEKYCIPLSTIRTPMQFTCNSISGFRKWFAICMSFQLNSFLVLCNHTQTDHFKDNHCMRHFLFLKSACMWYSGKRFVQKIEDIFKSTNGHTIP